MDRPTLAPDASPTISFDTVEGCVGGHPVDGPYAEHVWLSRLGPTSLWLARFAVHHTGETWALPDVAAALGQVRPLLVPRAADRLARYRMAELHGGPAYLLVVGLLVRPMGGADLAHLPERLRLAAVS